MKPIEFPESNVVYAKDQPEYIPLPVFKADTPEGQCISCWELTFTERLRILFTGKLWVSLMTFNKPLTPSYFTTKKSEVLNTEN
jgi:predicted amidohydrolase